MGTNKSLTFVVKVAANFAEVILSIISFSIAALLPLECGVKGPRTQPPQTEEGLEYWSSQQYSIHAPFEELMIHV